MSKEQQKDWSKISKEDEEESRYESEDEMAADAEKLKLEYPSYDILEQKLTKAEQEANKNREDFLRALAEVENTKRRLSRDIESAHKYGLEKFILALLPVIDSLEMAIAKLKEDKLKGFERILEGNELTLKLFQNVLTKFGVEILDPMEQPFNPSYHQAISTQPTDEIDPNHICKVMQKGYVLNGRLVRPALVVVSKALEEK